MSEDMKPCPFCGGEAAEPDANNHTWCTEVSCGSTAYMSVEAWNRSSCRKPRTLEEALFGDVSQETIEVMDRHFEGRS